MLGFIKIHVIFALQASLITNYVQRVFHFKKDLFWTNTANNLIYSGQKALEELN